MILGHVDVRDRTRLKLYEKVCRGIEARKVIAKTQSDKLCIKEDFENSWNEATWEICNGKWIE